MLTNDYRNTSRRPEITTLKEGQFYVNEDINDCDILIIRNHNVGFSLINANAFAFVLCQDNAINFLNENNYREVDAKIVRKE